MQFDLSEAERIRRSRFLSTMSTFSGRSLIPKMARATPQTRRALLALMRILLAGLLLLGPPTVSAQMPAKPTPVNACAAELSPSRLTIYVPPSSDLQIMGRPVPEVRLAPTVMHLLDTGSFKSILLLIAAETTYARAQNTVDKALEGGRQTPVAIMQLRADEDTSQIKCLVGQHTTVTSAIHALQKIPTKMPK